MSEARPRRRAAHATPRPGWALPVLGAPRPRHGELLRAPLTALVLAAAAGGGLALLSAIGRDVG